MTIPGDSIGVKQQRVFRFRPPGGIPLCGLELRGRRLGFFRGAADYNSELVSTSLSCSDRAADPPKPQGEVRTGVGYGSREASMTRDEILGVLNARTEAWRHLDVDALVADYAPDAVVESPLAGGSTQGVEQ